MLSEVVYQLISRNERSVLYIVCVNHPITNWACCFFFIYLCWMAKVFVHVFSFHTVHCKCLINFEKNSPKISITTHTANSLSWSFCQNWLPIWGKIKWFKYTVTTKTYHSNVECNINVVTKFTIRNLCGTCRHCSNTVMKHCVEFWHFYDSSLNPLEVGSVYFGFLSLSILLNLHLHSSWHLYATLKRLS